MKTGVEEGTRHCSDASSLTLGYSRNSIADRLLSSVWAHTYNIEELAFDIYARVVKVANPSLQSPFFMISDFI